jgi:hypothetical protein
MSAAPDVDAGAAPPSSRVSVLLRTSAAAIADHLSAQPRAAGWVELIGVGELRSACSTS